ncbi:MAG: ribosomal protein L7/L12 [Gemmataceae bacterium]|nr:ribosomal protein L7/L12 [Gemmataceae bacterium]
MLAVLELWDFVWIALIVSLLAGGSTAIRQFSRADARRLMRIESKVDMLLKHAGLEFTRPADGTLSDEVKALAMNPAKKIAAIKLYREQTGVGLAEAKEAIERFTGEIE